jgi:archaellum biogenesis protein FlaJ (TadC family)
MSISQKTAWIQLAIFGALFIGWLTLLIMGLIQKTKKEITDERDKSIFRRASLWAAGISYSVVVILLLVLSITYMNRSSNTVPVNFPLLIVITGGATLVLTQAATALVLYGRKFTHE